MSRIAPYTVPLGIRRLAQEDMGEGATYDPPVDEDADAIMGVYDPVESDLGADDNARRTGTVLTEAEVSTGDRIYPAPDADEEEGQTVTQVTLRSYRNGVFDHYEATL